MGTSVTIQVVTDVSENEFGEVVAKVWERFDEIEQRFSRFRADSELTLANQNAGKPTEVSPEFAALLDRALELAKISQGVFDPTVLGLMVASGYDRDFAQVGTGQTKDNELAAAGCWPEVQLDTERGLLTLPAGVGLDLGGIAKGYAVDAGKEILAKHFQNFLLNAGGDICLAGKNLEGAAWRVGVEDPQGGELLARLALSDKAVATSGAYKRHWQVGDKTAHHIMNPQSGSPAKSDLTSVTVIAERAEQSDSLATTIFILGVKDGLQLAKELGVECLLVHTSGKLLGTPGIEKYLV